MKQIILPITVHLNVRLPLALLQPEPADVPTGRSRRPMPPGALRQKGTAAHLQQIPLFISVLFCLSAGHMPAVRVSGFCSSHTPYGWPFSRPVRRWRFPAPYIFWTGCKRRILPHIPRSAHGSASHICWSRSPGFSHQSLRSRCLRSRSRRRRPPYRAFAAALVCIVDTVVYTAGQISHDNSSYSVRSCS